MTSNIGFRVSTKFKEQVDELIQKELNLNLQKGYSVLLSLGLDEFQKKVLFGNHTFRIVESPQKNLIKLEFIKKNNGKKEKES